MATDARFPASLPVLTAMRRTADGRRWLAGLPTLVEELRRDWGLRLGAPYHGGSCSWVAPALRPDGTRAVFKVTWPHREARPEGEVLQLWDGRGAVRVYAHDPARWALLLEPCEPGTQLGLARQLSVEERLSAGAEVLRELWAAGSAPALAGEGKAGDGAEAGDGQAASGRGAAGDGTGAGDAWAAGGRPERERGGTGSGSGSTSRSRSGSGRGEPPVRAFSGSVELLADVTAGWADLLEERAASRHHWPAAYDQGLCRLAAGLLRELPHTARQSALLHGDFNPGNLLAAGRRPWLAIDTKPLYGDPAFDPWPLIEQLGAPFSHTDPHRVLTYRTALVADALGEDPDRVRAWAFARRVESALWSAEGAAEAEGGADEPGDGAGEAGGATAEAGEGTAGVAERAGTTGTAGAQEVEGTMRAAAAVAPGAPVPRSDTPHQNEPGPYARRLLREARVLAEVAGL